MQFSDSFLRNFFGFARAGGAPRCGVIESVQQGYGGAPRELAKELLQGAAAIAGAAGRDVTAAPATEGAGEDPAAGEGPARPGMAVAEPPGGRVADPAGAPLPVLVPVPLPATVAGAEAAAGGTVACPALRQRSPRRA